MKCFKKPLFKLLSVFVAFCVNSQVAAQQIDSTGTDIEIGGTLSTTNSVLATNGPNSGQLSVGERVFHDQEIKTGDEAAAEFEFKDKTLFAIGENSQITFDSFVYDPGQPDSGEMVVTAGIGSFRFVSGLIKKDKVLIKTPTSTIGIRGTAFDLHVTPDGEMVLALLSGEVTVCNRRRECRTTNTVGHLIKVALNGILTNPVKWSADLITGVPFTVAFPFINNQKPLKKALKLPVETIGIFSTALVNPGKKPGKVLKKSAKKITKTTKKVTTGTGQVLKKLFKKPLIRKRKRKKRKSIFR